MLDVDQLQDFVCSHGYGEATTEGLALAQSLFLAGLSLPSELIKKNTAE